MKNKDLKRIKEILIKLTKNLPFNKGWCEIEQLFGKIDDEISIIDK
jgi:hypothetical protein